MKRLFIGVIAAAGTIAVLTLSAVVFGHGPAELLGILISASGSVPLANVADAIAPVGTLWVNAIRMTVIPLVVSLLITGVASASGVAIYFGTSNSNC